MLRSKYLQLGDEVALISPLGFMTEKEVKKAGVLPESREFVALGHKHIYRISHTSFNYILFHE